MSAALSAGLLKEIRTLADRYPHKRAALLPALHLVQKECGFISPEAEEAVAGLLEIRPVQVREVVTFYTMFFRRPVGRFHIQVCSNLTCALLGGDDLLAHLQGKLGLNPGETSPDGKFTLSSVECLGACEQSPCVMVNEKLFGGLDPAALNELLKGLS
jgi:NADH-quinone oxidoreductase subunit E